MTSWIPACSVTDLEREDVVGFTHEGHDYAIYCDLDGNYYCTDALCTHGRVSLIDGLVQGHCIECPKHMGRFDYRTGAALTLPASKPLLTYAVKVENGMVCFNSKPHTTPTE